MIPSRLLDLADHIDATGMVYLVLPDGQVKPVNVDDYLAMSARELRGTLVLATRGKADRAGWARMGIETFEINRNPN